MPSTITEALERSLAASGAAADERSAVLVETMRKLAAHMDSSEWPLNSNGNLDQVSGSLMLRYAEAVGITMDPNSIKETKQSKLELLKGKTRTPNNKMVKPQNKAANG